MECKTIQRSLDGKCVMKIYPDNESIIVYVVKKGRIIFSMYKVFIESVVVDGEWKVKDMYCDGVDDPFHGIMSIPGTMRMTTFHNMDIAWRWFEKTKQEAEHLESTIDDPDICTYESDLLNAELCAPTSPYIESVNEESDEDSDDGRRSIYIRRESPPLLEATPVPEP